MHYNRILSVPIINDGSFCFKGKQDIKEIKNRSDLYLKNVLETVDYVDTEKIKTIYEERKIANDHESLALICSAIESKVKEIKSITEQQLDQYQIREALENYKILFKFRKELGYLTKEIHNQFAVVKSKSEKKFMEVYSSFSGRFGSTQQIDEVKTDLRDFEFLIEFSKLKIEMLGKFFLNL